MKEKIEKFMYPTMMILCVLAAVTSYMSGENNVWPIITFSWVAIAWGNSKSN
jgi:hypothetical protein